MKVQTNSRVYTVEQVAAMLNMTKRTAYAFCSATDKFKVERLGERLLRINKASFDAWMPDVNEGDAEQS